MTKHSLFAKYILAVALLATAATTAPDGKPLGEGHVYKTVADRKLSLYVTKPPGWSATDKRPALVFFHGGGFIGGSPGAFNEQCKYFASRGLVAITVEYRLMGKKEGQQPWERCVQDAKSAMRWIRANAEGLGIDPKRIGASGGSAGGNLAAFCGMVEGLDDPKDDLMISPKAKALILFNPVLDNGPGEWGNKRVGERFQEFSPAHNVTVDDPPTIIFLGTRDEQIPVKTVKAFKSKMDAFNIRCDLVLYEGQEHGFFNPSNEGGKYLRETLAKADKFLVELGWLK